MRAGLHQFALYHRLVRADSRRSDSHTFARRAHDPWQDRIRYTSRAMLENLTIESFTPLTGQPFRIVLADGSSLDAELQSVREVPVSGWRPEGNRPARQPFALLFLGRSQVVLPQAVYRLENETLGALEIFIVPIGRTPEGVSYEAVFA